MARIRSFRELRVYQGAMEGAMRIFLMTQGFPAEERYSLVDQVRRSSRSVCANLAEAWRRRRYEGSFVSKLNDAEGEAEETRVWLEFAMRCAYIREDDFRELDDLYDKVLGQMVRMASEPTEWRVH